MKILVTYRAIHNTAGGVERASSWLMNELVQHGHQVEFATLDKEDAISFYPLESSITWHKLAIGDPSLKASFGTRLNRICALRDILKKFKPDVAIGFQEASYLSTRLAAMGLGISVIAAERNSPSRFQFMPNGKLYLAFLSFAFARFITVQSEPFRSHYPKFLRFKIRVISNPVFPPVPVAHEKQKIILSVGRLEYQKNFQCLIAAFSKIAAEFPDWSLVIVGEGQDRPELQAKIEDFGLKHRIQLPGANSDLSGFYVGSSVFCLSSRWEGFPNALAEALSHGLPAIGFKGCDGVPDLIENGVNGLLAEENGNSDTLAAALAQMLKDQKLRDEMSINAIQSIKAYEPSAIFAQWERLFQDAAPEKISGE